MKFWGSFILVAFSIQVLFPVVVVINFQFNRQEIVQTLCEKRFNKTNHCQGVCHLKKLITQEGKNKPASSIRYKYSEPSLDEETKIISEVLFFSKGVIFFIPILSTTEINLDISTPPPQRG